ncbi:hypothetical protein HYC85_030564 [Camellia sinensis]|uniref:Uncharacterized protein n=1 Tax=Camellia sinensis TaxID=4442 RepID=A0A7J7G115_CAMSI|nr:hypothetical protein HYC85_030564 [Camellia sinensis]
MSSSKLLVSSWPKPSQTRITAVQKMVQTVQTLLKVQLLKIHMDPSFKMLKTHMLNSVIEFYIAIIISFNQYSLNDFQQSDKESDDGSESETDPDKVIFDNRTNPHIDPDNLDLIFDLDDLGLEELDDGLPRLTGGSGLPYVNEAVGDEMSQAPWSPLPLISHDKISKEDQFFVLRELQVVNHIVHKSFLVRI